MLTNVFDSPEGRQRGTKLDEAGIDPSGELGEYHALVTDGPIFSSEVSVKKKDRINHNGYWFLEVEPEQRKK